MGFGILQGVAISRSLYDRSPLHELHVPKPLIQEITLDHFGVYN